MLSEAGRRQRPHIAGGVTTPYPPSRVSACQVIQFAVIDGVHDGLVWLAGKTVLLGAFFRMHAAIATASA